MRMFKRKRFLIDKKMQLKYAVLTAAMLLLYTLMLLAAIFIPPALIFFSTDLPIPVRAEAANAFILLNNYIWPGIGFVIILFGAISIVFTHKIAGPLHVMTRAMGDVTNGDLKVRVTLRRGDDLLEMKDAMNRMVEKLESSFTDLDNHVSEASLHAQEAAQGQSLSSAPKVAAVIEEMKKILEGYKFGVTPK